MFDIIDEDFKGIRDFVILFIHTYQFIVGSYVINFVRSL